MSRTDIFPVKVIGKTAPVAREIMIWHIDSSESSENWHIPEETPVAFVYNRRNYAVMLATPHDLVDYAVGFSLTEEIVDKIEDIQGLNIVHSERGVDFRIQIEQQCLTRLDLKQRRRNLVGNASCGVCGLESADSLFQDLPEVAKEPVFLEASAIDKAMNDLASHQKLNSKTHSVHGAAWVNPDGEIQMLREDVGRHNALDKLLGTLALENTNMKNGFVLMSSRGSYELVEKAAKRGVQAMVTISGPTGFALQKAQQAKMTLYTRSSNTAVRLTG